MNHCEIINKKRAKESNNTSANIASSIVKSEISHPVTLGLISDAAFKSHLKQRNSELFTCLTICDLNVNEPNCSRFSFCCSNYAADDFLNVKLRLLLKDYFHCWLSCQLLPPVYSQAPIQLFSNFSPNFKKICIGEYNFLKTMSQVRKPGDYCRRVTMEPQTLKNCREDNGNMIFLFVLCINVRKVTSDLCGGRGDIYLDSSLKSGQKQPISHVSH